MKWIVKPSRLHGTIHIPPSKSHTIRSLLISTLADGISKIRKPLLKGDCGSALQAARTLGAKIEMSGEDFIVQGVGGNLSGAKEFFDMGNSGTATNLFTATAALGTKPCTFDGDSSLRSRPFRPVLDALKQLGLSCTFQRPNGDLPYTLQGPIRGGTTTVDGISSQFVSALLFACPLIRNSIPTTINVINLHEQPYVELTLWWLKKQNISIEYESDFSKFVIPGNQQYHPFDMTVPADFSSATFSAIGAAIAGDDVSIRGLDFSDPQGDKAVFDILKSAGVNPQFSATGVSISSQTTPTGRIIDLNTMPDALPALSVLACASKGETQIVNVAQARIKETDRITVMREELTKMGADIEERPDGLIIRQSALKGAHVDGRDDHRVVMALSLAGMIAEGVTEIDTAESVDVSYPTFIDDFRALGAQITPAQ